MFNFKSENIHFSSVLQGRSLTTYIQFGSWRGHILHEISHFIDTITTSICNTATQILHYLMKMLAKQDNAEHHMHQQERLFLLVSSSYGVSAKVTLSSNDRHPHSYRHGSVGWLLLCRCVVWWLRTPPLRCRFVPPFPAFACCCALTYVQRRHRCQRREGV